PLRGQGSRAIGRGATPAPEGTPGGGSGGAIYTDGNSYTVTIGGTVITGNSATEGGGAASTPQVTRACSSRAGALRSSSPPPSAKASAEAGAAEHVADAAAGMDERPPEPVEPAAEVAGLGLPPP